jgi:hypothetical protein
VSDQREAEESACAQFLIELAFLLPRGTDLKTHPLSDKLVAYVEAIRVAQLAATHAAIRALQRYSPEWSPAWREEHMEPYKDGAWVLWSDLARLLGDPAQEQP